MYSNIVSFVFLFSAYSDTSQETQKAFQIIDLKGFHFYNRDPSDSDRIKTKKFLIFSSIINQRWPFQIILD